MALAGLSWLFARTQELKRRERTEQAFRAVGLGLSNYFDARSEFPPFVLTSSTGEPLASWRFEILNWVDGGPPKVLDKPWNNPANRGLNEQPLWLFCFGRARHTNVMAIDGPGTPFEVSHQGGGYEQIQLDTILLIEVKDSGVHWMEPGDFPLDRLLAMDEEAASGRTFGVDSEGFHVGFVDGEVWFLSSETPIGLLRQFATVDGAAKHDRDDLLSKYRIE